MSTTTTTTTTQFVPQNEPIELSGCQHHHHLRRKLLLSSIIISSHQSTNPMKRSPPSSSSSSPFDLNVEYKPPPITEVEIDPPKTEDPIPEKTDLSDPISQVQEPIDEDDDGFICAVCQSTDGDPSDPIVFCDGCDLMVHKTCYGSPLIEAIPEGDWFCAQCSKSQSLKSAFS